MYARLRRGLPVFTLAAFATFGAAGCETTTPPPPTNPIPPKTVTFSGTLTINGAITHRFIPTVVGEIDVRLKTLAPVDTATIGMALGHWTGTSCQIVIADDNAILNALLIGTATTSGEFCARLYDVGKLSEPSDYTIDVTHF